MMINPVIFGCRGPELLPTEAVFFRDCNPWGFILFGRNIETPNQVRRLCADLRNTVGRDTLIFIDQEGGRVQRLGPPHWRKVPYAFDFGELYRLNKQDGLRAIWLNFRLIAAELIDVGINANCAPVLDLPVFGADAIISDRAFSRCPDEMIEMANACINGLTAGGVVPVIKHIPGHGRALVDSHKALPVITETIEELDASDFIPFKALSATPIAMTAHIVLEKVDAKNPITVSRQAFQTIVREKIGFKGLVMSDDLDMKALSGSLDDLAEQTLDAGCDIVLQCNGHLNDMVKVAKGLKPLTGDSLRRAQQAELRNALIEPINTETALEEYEALMRQLDPAT